MSTGMPGVGPYGVVALHGFLGHPDDWSPLRSWLPDVRWSAVDLWSVIGRRDVQDWTTLGAAIESEIASAAAAAPEVPTIVLAYSLGARLVLASPGAAAHVAGTCLVSCHPGLDDSDGTLRGARRLADETWAERLLDWETSAFLEAWNRQPVLAASAPLRAHHEFPAGREALAKALRDFSLAGQPDWSDRLRRWQGPLLLVAGERDTKFVGLARRFEHAGPNPAVRIVAEAGHRVPWDVPERFAEVFAEWAEGLISRSRT